MASRHASGRHAHCVGSHVGHGILHVTVLGWWWRLVFKRAKFVFLSLQVIIGVRTHFAIGTSLVGATMSETRISSLCVTTIGKMDRSLLGKVVRSRKGFATVGANVGPLLGVGADVPKRQEVSG